LQAAYFFAFFPQPHPQPPLAGVASIFTMQSFAPQAAQFFGWQRVSLVAPHLSHLNSAIFITSCLFGFFLNP